MITADHLGLPEYLKRDPLIEERLAELVGDMLLTAGHDIARILSGIEGQIELVEGRLSKWLCNPEFTLPVDLHRSMTWALLRHYMTGHPAETSHFVIYQQLRYTAGFDPVTVDYVFEEAA